ncbi:MAG: hypothetical protein ABR568_17815 [Pyrinomonadaceae bacterium]
MITIKLITSPVELRRVEPRRNVLISFACAVNGSSVLVVCSVTRANGSTSAARARALRRA